MTTLLFYERPVALDRTRHADLRLRADAGYAFARRINSVMLVGVEFAEAQRHYPIVFVEVAPKQFFPAALLGVRAHENFVDEQGGWEAGRYLPAFVRRYPFVITPEMNVCIDEASPALDREEGEPLFLEGGAESPALQRAVAFLASFQQEVVRTQAFCDALRDLGLLSPWAVQIVPENGEPYRMSGLHVVDAAKVAALPDDRIAAWFRSGDLARLQAHVFSLGNLTALTGRAGSGKPAASAAARAAPHAETSVAASRSEPPARPAAPASTPQVPRETSRRRAKAK